MPFVIALLNSTLLMLFFGCCAVCQLIFSTRS